MLCTLFMPIMIALGVLLYLLLFHTPENNFWTDRSIMLGLPIQVIAVSLISFPFVLWLWMLWSGNWRRPVLLAAIVYVAVFFIAAFELIEQRTPPQKRNISLTGVKGTDVYCNGVHLGQLPLKIHVDELIAKVPEWTTPPEQRWYDDTTPDQRLCTWIPWDDFLKERFEASKELFATDRNRTVSTTPKATKARLEALLKYDAGCRYWWSYRFADTQMAFVRSGNPPYLNRPFDKESGYYFGNNIAMQFSPSVGYLAQLLSDVLPELSPEQKADWDRLVLKNWGLIAGPLRRTLKQTETRLRQDKNESLAELYESALDSTARQQYRLSNPPTEEECRRLLADWVKASIDDNLFFFDTNWYLNSRPDVPTVGLNVLMPADIREPMRQPLMEQWTKDKYRWENGWAPVAYLSWKDKSPDYFADFARWAATTDKARIELLENEAPGAAALFKTLLYRRSLSELFTYQIYRYPTQISLYSQVNNPLVENDFREYVIKALSDPKHNDASRSQVEQAVVGAVFDRINRKEIDKEELAAWVSSLPIPASSKNLALRTLRLRSDNALTFADQLQKAAGQNVLIETELTLDDVVKWFADNPEGTLQKFVEEQEDSIIVSNLSNGGRNRRVYASSVSDVDDVMNVGNSMGDERWDGTMPTLFVRTLLNCDSPEGDSRVRELIRRIWKIDPERIEQAIIDESNRTINVQRRNNFVAEVGSVYLPEYILDLYLSPEWNKNINIDLASALAFCESPKAGTILEQWVGMVSAVNKPRVERSLEVWRTRSALRQKKMEVFQDLVSGRMVPDDLLLPQPPWVWKDGEYVQGTVTE